MTIRFYLLFISLVILSFAAAWGADKPHSFTEQAGIDSFIHEMVKEHRFDARQLDKLFARARLHPSIIEAITRPAEAKPWYEYRPIFIQKSRIKGGVNFWNQQQALLQQAKTVYGVPAEIIVSILGVETRYGQHQGRYPVLDSLATLAFAYPPRSKFFRSELKQFLLLTREEGYEPLSLLGSYAGAMGMPQFIPSSFRSYAVDFDGDGKRDLWNNPADVIGSVANYFRQHAWKPGQPITHRVRVSGLAYKKLLSKDLKPKWSAQEFAQHGVTVPAGLPDDLRGTLLELETKDGPEYWVGWHNFYVISRYNHSALYSMAVYQLSEQIREHR